MKDWEDVPMAAKKKKVKLVPAKAKKSTKSIPGTSKKPTPKKGRVQKDVPRFA